MLLEEKSATPEHELNGLFPFVNPDKLPIRGTATPSESAKLAPSTDEGVLELQNTPKSRPSPETPVSKAIWSAIFAFCKFAKYAYQFPSVAWTILSCFPFNVTSGSPFPSSVSEICGSLITTSTTIEPANLFSKVGFSADTNRFGLLASASKLLNSGNTSKNIESSIGNLLISLRKMKRIIHTNNVVVEVILKIIEY